MYFLIDIGTETIYATGNTPYWLLRDFRKNYTHLFARGRICPEYYSPICDLLLDMLPGSKVTWQQLQAALKEITNYVKLVKVL